MNELAQEDHSYVATREERMRHRHNCALQNSIWAKNRQSRATDKKRKEAFANFRQVQKTAIAIGEFVNKSIHLKERARQRRPHSQQPQQQQHQQHHQQPQDARAGSSWPPVACAHPK